MKDIRALIDDIWGEEDPNFPFFREKQELTGNTQNIGNIDFSRISRISRSELQPSQANIQILENSTNETRGLDRASRVDAKTPGIPGTPGNASEDKDLFFPVDRERTGNPGNLSPAGRYSSDASSAMVPVATIPRQTDIFRCFICSVHETAEKPLLPVLSEIRGEHHWMHSACWPEHVRRCAQARAAAPASRERVAS